MEEGYKIGVYARRLLRDVSHSRKEKVAYMSADFPSITH